MENGQLQSDDSRYNEPQSVTPTKKGDTEFESNTKKSLIERQHENVDALINCVMKNIGFSNGKPVAAFTIYRCLLYWKSFEAEKTSVFDRLIQMIGTAIENEDNNEHMAYWLSTTFNLLFLLQKSLKATGGPGATSNRKPPAATSLFGRMTMGFRSSPSSSNLAASTALAIVRQVEAKYPALLFKQHLAAYVEKIYGIIRDNLKKELSSLLSLCIQASRTSKGGVLRSGRSFGKDSPATHWQSIIDNLNTLLSFVFIKESYVPIPGFRSSPSSSNLAASTALAIVRQVEAKYPALLFKQHLEAYVEKIYGIIRDNLKKELSSLLSLCIQAPRTSKGGVLRSGRSFGKDSPATHWQSIIDNLNTLLSTLKQNFVPPVLVQKIYTQTFSYINVQLFNSLLLRRECCTFSNGEYVTSGLAELELWCCQAKEEYAGCSWDELKHIRQAVGFLVIHQKYRISYDDITHDLCPILSVQQLYRICTLYWDDNYNTRSVSPDVISSMRVLMTEDSNNAVSSSFLLDDNSGIPFSVDDLANSLQEKDFMDLKPAEDLGENPAFQFLHE